MEHPKQAWISCLLCTVILLIATAVLLSLHAPAAQAQAPNSLPGFRVQGRHLYDRYGNKVILVGVNKMVIYTNRTGIPSFPEIAKTGANVVRIVWLTEGSAEELDIAISNAISHQLIPMIDCHDSTGRWDKLSDCVDYWVRPDILPVLKHHEAYLLVNIANEAGSGVVPSLEFRAAYELAIRRMRAAGIHVPLIIDAQGWGQNIDDLQLNAPYLIQADPDHNLMFSIHMWWPSAWRGSGVEQLVIDEIAESVEMELPLIIGEFANKGPGCSCCIPYETIIEQAHLNEVGYLPWSWGPGNLDCAEMDMTEDGTFETLHGWGLEVAITSPHSIRNIAVRPDWIVNATAVAPPTPAPSPTPLPAPEGLLSIGKRVETSSVESEELPGQNAVDGRLNSRWASAYADPQWIAVDLGEIHTINRIVLVWEAAYGKEYKLQVSDDGERWTDVLHVTDGTGGWNDHLVTASGRYVRMEGLQRGTQWGYSLYEFWIFDRADLPLPESDTTGAVSGEEDKRPDFVITGVHWSPDPLVSGDAVVFQAAIENRGAGHSPLQPVRCVFQIGGETVAVGEFTKPLSPGFDTTCVGSPWQTDEPGEFVVLAWVDGDPERAVAGVPHTPYVGEVEESNETNNMFTAHGLVRLTSPPATPTRAPTSTPLSTAIEDMETPVLATADTLSESVGGEIVAPSSRPAWVTISVISAALALTGGLILVFLRARRR
jgi:mannan endo-1,4-beta-mannosidase